MKSIRHLHDIAGQIAGAKSILLASGASHPGIVARQLDERSDAWPDIAVHTFMPLGPCPFAREGGLQVVTAFPGRQLRAAVSEGRATVMRETLGNLAAAYRDGRMRADVVVLHVAPPDRNGAIRLGPSVDLMPGVLSGNPLVVAVMNARMPQCGPRLDPTVVDFFIEEDAAPFEMKGAVVDEIDLQIAEHVCGLLTGTPITLETGIGAVPETVLRAAAGLPGLLIHAGLITDAIMDVADGIDHPIVSTIAAGSAHFYDYLDNNEAVDLRAADYTNATETIAMQPNFHAVNGALQVDLTGAVNTECVGGKRLSALGGLPDFSQGAQGSSGGKSIIALRSTSRGGETATLVPNVEQCSLDGRFVDFVVTEYGVAELRRQSPSERAKRLLAIAHPAHRDALQQAMVQL